MRFVQSYVHDLQGCNFCRLPSSITYGDVILLQLPPNPQGVRSPQPVHAVHSAYCRVLRRVPLWEYVHSDGKCRTWSNYHGNRVQYPHCCSITMVIRMQYSLVLRTYVRTARTAAHKKKLYHAFYIRTYLSTSILVWLRKGSRPCDERHYQCAFLNQHTPGHTFCLLPVKNTQLFLN